ncbi:MAG: anthranilate phosphoribosyltransferase family protein [Cyanobacteria bacterium P01_A01_bin.123]
MSDVFKALLKKVGSGTHTSQSLTREEAATATQLMLTQAATPAQIGAFMIAHRIRRPTPTELAGMLDAYDDLGPALMPIEAAYPPTVFCAPYDGRSRTAPISPLTALILIAANAPVVLHGSDRMPTKYGLSLIEIWQALDLPLHQLTLAQSQRLFEQTGFGFVYQPTHFPLAQALVPYRDQIGKRPTLATVELMWSPYHGEHHLVTGFVHPPTEERAQIAYEMRQQPFYTMVKGLEGSCDLPRSRTAILGLGNPGQDELARLLLHPRDYDLDGEDIPLLPLPQLIAEIKAVLAGKTTDLYDSARWNGGFYLWRCGVVSSVEAGLATAEKLLHSGAVGRSFEGLRQAIADLALVSHPN